MSTDTNIAALRKQFDEAYRRGPESERTRICLEYASTVIDILAATRPAATEFYQIGNEATQALGAIYSSSASDDEFAEKTYQNARLFELMSTCVGRAGSLEEAGHCYGSATRISRRGTGVRTSFYEAELAAFQARWPKVNIMMFD